MEEKKKFLKPGDQIFNENSAARLLSYPQEYMMDPRKIKKTLYSLNPRSECAEIIVKIMEEQFEYIRKCTNAKILMERKIRNILLDPKYKKVLF